MGKKGWLKLAALSGMLYFGNMSANSIPPAENLLQPIVSTPHYNLSSQEDIERIYRDFEPKRNVAFKVHPVGNSITEWGCVVPADTDSISVTFNETNYSGISACYRVIDYNITPEGTLFQYLGKGSLGRIITEISPHWTTPTHINPSEVESTQRNSLTTPQPDSLYVDGQWFRIRGLPVWPDSSRYGFFFSQDNPDGVSSTGYITIYKRDKHALDYPGDPNGDNDVDILDGNNIWDNIGRHMGDDNVKAAEDPLFQDSAHIYDTVKDSNDIPIFGEGRSYDDKVTLRDLVQGWALFYGQTYGAGKIAVSSEKTEEENVFYFNKTVNEGKITYSVVSDTEIGNIRSFALGNIEGIINGEFEIESGNIMDDIQTDLGYSKPLKMLFQNGDYGEIFDKRVSGGAVFYQNPSVSIETEKIIPDSLLSANLTLVKRNEDGNLFKEVYKLSVAEAGSRLAGGRNETGSSGTGREEGSSGNVRGKDSLTGILSEEPYEFSVKPPYPNPFNSIINIQFTLPKNLEARLDIFNVSGQRVRTIESQYNTGINTETWDGRDDEGNISPSGIYFFRLRANDSEGNKTWENTGKITVLR